MRSKVSAFTLVLTLALLTFAAVLPIRVPAAEPQWKASWITHPTAPLREPIVLHFRRSLELESKPARYVVHVSADNRFILYVMAIGWATARRVVTWRTGVTRPSISLRTSRPAPIW